MDEYYYDLDYRRDGRAKRRRRQRIPTHKMIGIAMVFVAIVFILLVWGTREDASGALFIGGGGLYLLFGRFEESKKKRRKRRW